MSFFDDANGFEDIMNNFFGQNSRHNSRRSYSNNANLPLKQVVSEKRIFLIFDFSGEQRVDVEIRDQLIVNDYNEEVSTGKKLLEIKSVSKKIGEYVFPNKFKLKDFKSTFNNGILEVSFKK